MKKSIILIFLTVFAFAMTSAQNTDIIFGAKAGVNFASIGGDFDDFDGRTSFHVGAVAEIVISEKFSVQPELLYNSVGAAGEESESFEGTSVNFESTLKLDYISLPIMAKYYVTEGLSLEAGPQIGFLTSAKFDFEASGGGESESEEVDVKDEFKSIDFGLGFGAGYKLPSGLNFSARYVLGLSNIAEDSGDDFSVQNNVLQISVGFMF